MVAASTPSRHHRSSTSSSHFRHRRRSPSSSHSRHHRRSPSSSHSRRYYRSSRDASDSVMFDTLVWRSELVNDTIAYSRTSTGFDVSVSLRLAAPPAFSRVHVHLPQFPWRTPDRYFLRESSKVLAADADLLLLRIAVKHNYPKEYFVYRADPLRPSLKRLPPLGDEWGDEPGERGVARRGKDFVVAVLQSFFVGRRLRPVVKLARFSSASDDEKWEVEDMSYDPCERPAWDPHSWYSAAVFSFGGTMCWVDYTTGLLLCDVFDETPELRFVPFPDGVPPVDTEPGVEVIDNYRGQIQSYRTVGVNSDGLVEVVEVDNIRIKTSGFSATTWTLRAPRMVWKRRATVDVDRLWARDFRDACLPRSVPEYPTVSREEPDAVHFILQRGEVWIITIDMRTQMLRSYTTCSKDDFHNMAFLYSDVSRHLKMLPCRPDKDHN